MCQTINSSFILIHRLSEKNECTVKELVNKKYIIESEIPSVFIDVSRTSLLNSVHLFPEIFKWNDGIISKKENSAKFFQPPFINFFEVNIDASTTSKIKDLLNGDHYQGENI